MTAPKLTVMVLALMLFRIGGAPAQEYILDSWNIEDGLPVNSINQVIQDRTGYLWLATTDGLVRFDGVRFAVFNTMSHSEMQSNRISDIAEAADGSLWWNTGQSHLVSLDKGVFKHHTEVDGLPNRAVTGITKDKRGVLWFGTRDGVAFYDGGALNAFAPSVVTGRIDRLFARGNGELWYRRVEDLSIYRYRGGRAEKMLPAQSLGGANPMYELESGELLIAATGNVWKFGPDSVAAISRGLPATVNITTFYQDGAGTVWAMSRGAGVFSLDGDRWVYRFEGRESGKDGGSMFPDSEGNFWIVGSHVVYRNETRVFESLTPLNHAVADYEGGLWLATFNRGLHRIKPRRFFNWGREEGLPDANIYPVLAAADGSVWAGSHDGGPVRIAGGVAESGFSFPPGDAGRFVRTLVERVNGDILAGAIGRDLFRYSPDDNHFYRFEPAFGQAIGTCYALFEDSRGRLWAGTDGGVFMLENGAWRTVLADHRGRANYIRYFTEAPDGGIWMASNGQGILHWRDGELTRIDNESGLVSNNIRALLAEESDSGYILWVGSEDRGLQRLEMQAGRTRPRSFTSIQQQHGLFDNVIHVILPDEFGRLWMNTNRGVFWVDKRELEDFAAGRIDTVNSTSYGLRDGLRNREGNGGVQSPGTVGPDGSLWFPTQGGLARVDPATIVRNERPARPVIESVAFGDSIYTNSGGTLKLARDHRDFQVSFTGLSMRAPEKVRFQYKLDGFDADWRSTGQREATYTNIPAGDYTFMLEAANSDGVWSESPATLTMTIAPRFHETAWFYVLLLLALAMAFFMLISWRTRQIRQRQKVLEEVVEARTRELVEEKELTEQQARRLEKLDEAKTRFFTNISHELRTPLTLIMGPIQEFLDKEKISKKVRDGHNMALRNSKYLLRLINQILDLSKLEAGEIRLQPRQADFAAFVQDVVALFRPVCEQKGIELAAACEPAAIDLVFDSGRMEQVVANLVSNAIKFTPSGGLVRVNVRQDGPRVELTVEDSGIGIAPDEHELVFRRFYQADTSETRTGAGTGVGLSLVKNLVELHGGEITLQSEPGHGSRFTVTLDRHALDQVRISEQDALGTRVAATSRVGDGAPTYDIAVGQSSVADILRPQTSAHLETQTADQIPSGKADPDKPSILIADDNGDMRAFIRRVLGGCYHLIEAADGNEALRLCREALPDLVILDVMMPGLDGFSVGRALQDDETLRGIPMVFLTAKGRREDRLEGFESGAVAYLTKPFEPEFLKIQIGNLIEQQMLIREKLRQDTPAVSVPADPFEAKIVEMLGREFMNADFGVKELALAMNVDRSQLFKKIKACSGLPPSKYIQKFRLSQAKQLLADGRSGSVSQVAYGCGFNNLSWFSKCFREQFGTRPGEYT